MVEAEKGNGKKIIFTILFVIIFTACLVFCLTSDMFKVRKIEVKNASNLDIDKIKNELQFFKDNYKIIDNHIDFYYIGKNDRIIPANRLEKYCQNYNLAYKLLECGHYPFSYFTNFKDILDI